MGNRSCRRRQLGLALALGLTGLTLAGCPRPVSRSPGALRDVPATVRHFPQDSNDFVLVPEDTISVLYLADELPVPFRSEGLRVVFSGTPRKTSGPRADYVIPITLTAIRRRDAGSPGPL